MSSSYSQMRPLTGAGPAPGHTANSMSTSGAQGSGANTMRRRKYSSISLMRGSLSTSENKDNFLVYLRRRGSSALSLLAGVLIGLIIASALMGGSSGGSSWHPSGGSLSTNWNPRMKQTSLPTLEQRERIIKVLGTLTGRHTRFCLRKAQKAYRRQVYERYEPIVGYQRKNSRRGVLSRLVPKLLKKRGLFSHSDHEETEINKIFHSDSRNGGKGMSQGHKYYFAINLYNSFDIIPDLFSNMFRVSAILGYNNVFISVYENGSSDQTKALLRVFDALCRSVGLRVTIRSSQRRRGAFAHRIEYLAEVRNAALVPLQELRDATGEVFDSIIFMNDVLPCVDDLLELIWQSRRQNAGITCGSDYIFHDEVGAPVFYDNWVARDINGTALENAPFENVFHDTESTHRFQRHLPIQVQSCWNGIAILDPAPMYAHPHVRFRMANLPKGECSASECSLICNDYWEAGYGRIIMIPRVKLAYEGVSWVVLSYACSSAHTKSELSQQSVFHLIHPERRNLTTIRGYTRLGGNADDPHSDPQDRSWHGPHDRLFRQEESEAIVFKQPPPYVWCWGWDGPGDLEGPDVEPIWEKMPNLTFDPVIVRHDRSFVELG